LAVVSDRYLAETVSSTTLGEWVTPGRPPMVESAEAAYGPLVVHDRDGWSSVVRVQSAASNPIDVRLVVLGAAGDVAGTAQVELCPMAGHAWPLAAFDALPERFVGSVRVESMAPLADFELLHGSVEFLRAGPDGQPDAAAAYDLLGERDGFDWPEGRGEGGLASGNTVIAVPRLEKGTASGGSTTLLAVANLVGQVGFTDFTVFVYDQNGLVDYWCGKVQEQQIETVDLDRWGSLSPGFRGSAVVSAGFWEHDVFAGEDWVRNPVGLGVAVLDGGPAGQADASAASIGVAMGSPAGADWVGSLLPHRHRGCVSLPFVPFALRQR
jgi:hypothetical protein